MAIREVVGIGPDAAGTLHLLDGLSLSWRAIRLTSDPSCRTCGASS
jgi:adenylyltransferase/sulfurtransferase